MLPNLRPNTEDFLTFLCFRGTNTLPRELDFENTHNQASTSSGHGKASKTSDKRNKELKIDSKKKPALKKNETITAADNQKVTKQNNIVEVRKDPKTGFMPFAVRKRAEVHPTKHDKKKMQTVTKKNQSLKQQLNSQNKDTSIGPRTTRANPFEEEKIISGTNINVKKGNKRKTITAETTLEASESQATCSKSLKIEKSAAIANLSKNFNESGSNHSKELQKKQNNQDKEEKRETRLSSTKKPVIKVTKKETKRSKGTSSESEQYSSDDDNEPLIKQRSKNASLTAKSMLRKNDSLMNLKQKEALSKKLSDQESYSKDEKLPKEVEKLANKKVERKRKINVDLEIANSQANTTDFSENETRGRPMRKTKEAATIYMELIGRKLTLQDSSDNDSSLDSLEVPNLKRVELMEIELKANCEKAKEAASEKKRVDIRKAIVAEEKSLKLNQSINNSNVREDEKQILQKIADINSLEKSFNDSDEEPLATKILKPVLKTTAKKRGRKSNQELAEIKALQDSLSRKNEKSAKKSDAEKTLIENPLEGNPNMKDKLQTSQLSSNKIPLDSLKLSSATKVHVPSSALPIQEFGAHNDDDEFVKGFDTGVTKPITSLKTSINLLPSKEESEKIFGIASVTLAQSCGPLDTKCTLGKCGSVHVHKPPLGPTVLTESALGASLSPKDRRKSKVNMTRDQIQKWLEEASWTPIPDELETIELKATSKASTSSFGLSKSGDDSQSSSLLKEKIIDLPSPSTSGKEYAPKAKLLKTESQVTTKFMAKVDKTIEFNFPLKTEESSKKLLSKSGTLNNQKANRSQSSPILTAVNNSANNCNSPEKKTPIYQQQHQNQQRRTPVYKTENISSSKLTPMLPKSFGAFSPENEHSVYSFDREDDNLPISSTPFRRSNSKAESEAFQKPSLSSSKLAKQPSHVSLTLSPEENKKSASISVEMTEDTRKIEDKMDNSKEKEAENDSDSEGHTFYIPLQASNASGSKTIQGVAVKLGTEGAEGPNQRIIMHAKLVTKSRTNAATALPESMTNVQELVKTLMASKETSKPVPCATVQPRFKSYDSAAENTLQPEPSTSSLVVNQRSKQQPKLGEYFIIYMFIDTLIMILLF